MRQEIKFIILKINFALEYQIKRITFNTYWTIFSFNSFFVKSKQINHCHLEKGNSEYPLITNFASRLCLALMVMSLSRSILRTEQTILPPRPVQSVLTLVSPPLLRKYYLISLNSAVQCKPYLYHHPKGKKLGKFCQKLREWFLKT